jgi:hypothetical protein
MNLFPFHGEGRLSDPSKTPPSKAIFFQQEVK